MASQLTLCNNALAEIAADPISSIDENSIQGRECARIFPQIIQEFLTWADWDYTTTRVILALQTNDRLGEWLYKYASPSNVAQAQRVLPTFDTQLGAMPQAGPFTAPMIETVGCYPFLISEGSIYTNVPDAVLEYTSTEVQIGQIGATEARAIELELASRLAMPIKKSRELKGDLIKQAEVAKERAIADCENRNPKQQPNYISAVEWARAGMIDGELWGPVSGV